METHKSVKIVLTVSYVLQIASFCKRFSFSFNLVLMGHFSFYLVLVFFKDLVLVFVTKILLVTGQ